MEAATTVALVCTVLQNCAQFPKDITVSENRDYLHGSVKQLLKNTRFHLPNINERKTQRSGRMIDVRVVRTVTVDVASHVTGRANERIAAKVRAGVNN